MPVANAMDGYPPMVRIARWKGGYWLGRPLNQEGIKSLLLHRYGNYMTHGLVQHAWDLELRGTVTLGIWGRTGRLLWLLSSFESSSGLVAIPLATKIHALEAATKDYAVLASAWSLLDLSRFLLPEEAERSPATAEDFVTTPRGLPLSVVRGATSLERLTPPIVEFDTEPYQLLGLDPWLMPVTQFAPWYLEMRQQGAS